MLEKLGVSPGMALLPSAALKNSRWITSWSRTSTRRRCSAAVMPLYGVAITWT